MDFCLLSFLGGVFVIEIYSLSGPSGTGKSTIALQFAHQHHIPAIIDDGLLIIEGEKVAGISAKFEKNSITAVRRAIFSDEQHKAEVQKAIQKNKIESLLIIGTSDKMTKKIVERLELGDIQHFSYVKDVRSPREIKIARFIRETQGKHVMPIPYKQVQQNFFRKLVHRGLVIFSNKKEKIGETTIVRPDFQQGTIQIAKSVYMDIIEHVCSKMDKIVAVNAVQFHMDSLPITTLKVTIAAPVNYNVMEKMEEAQKEIQRQFVCHLGIELDQINLYVQGIQMEKIK